jgi:two-component system, cell cycle sensor histidine kinase and response regulator CckA
MSDTVMTDHSADEIRQLRLELAEAHRRIDGLQAELAEKNRFLNTLLEITPDFFALKDTGSVYRFVSPALCRFLGKSAEEMIGKSDFELFPLDDASLHVARDAEVVRTARPLEGDWSIAGPEGKFWFKVTKVPVFDSAGKVSGVFCMVQNVTRRKKAEIEFERFFNLMPELVCIATVSGYFTKVNPAWQKTLGYTEQELLSTPFIEWLHPDDVASTKAELERRVSGQEGTLNVVNRYRAKDGSYHWFEWNSTPVEEGVLYAVARDITDRIEQEMNTRRWAYAFRLCAHGIAIGDPKTNQVLTCNEAFARLCGWSVKEIEGFSIPTLYAPEDRETVMRNIEIVDSTGFSSYQARMLRKDGTTIPVQMDVVSVRGEDGRLIYRIATVQDITERLASQTALRESETRFRSVVESAPDAIFIQTDGCFAYLNRSAIALFGASKAEEILGRRVVDMVHPDYRGVVIERIRHVNEFQHSAPALEERFLRLDGSELFAEVSAVPFVFAGKQGALVFLRDISRRKKVEHERAELEHQLFESQKLESIGRLAGGIAHDLNNLLTPVLGYSEMLSRAFPETDKRLKRIEIIHHASLKARDLVRQLLAFSSRQALEFRMIDLNAVIREFEQLLRRTIRDDIDIRYHLHEGAMVMLGDASQLEQILMNLAVNAEDAMPAGGKLLLETSPMVIEPGQERYFEGLAAGDYAVLSVHDTGGGIGRETLGHIFEPFFTTKPKGQGTGFGLSTVYGIVRQHGGIIQVESEPGAGTSFRIYFPLRSSEAEPVEPLTAMPVQKSDGATVLVVEDDEMVRKFVVQALIEEGFDIREAEGGEQALALLEQGKFTPDLLLTDLVMRGMNGRVLYDKVCAIIPRIKVIYMSGYTKDIISRHGVLDEGLTFLQKPFPVPVLLDKVREVLQNGG